MASKVAEAFYALNIAPQPSEYNLSPIEGSLE